MSSANRAVYVGVTDNLLRRVSEHKGKEKEGHTKKYNETKLVYFEETNDAVAAIEREKQLKRWSRAKKFVLIARMNPRWEDLSQGWFG
jgi:putative endonuclease